jgi:hypothetical protein
MSSVTAELESFAKEALSRGLGRPAVKQVMLDAGWSTAQAQAALDAYADLPFLIPVPRPRAQLSAREAFLYLLLFTTLYLSCYHLGAIAFELINRVYPDITVRRFGPSTSESLRWSIAYLLIAFPAFAFISRYVAIDVARQPIKRLSPVRRWLTYLTLFIAAGTLIGDLVTLAYNVLGGELTVRVLLKVLVVLLIAGITFAYYLSDLRREEQQ